jgi:hypothetical protein
MSLCLSPSAFFYERSVLPILTVLHPGLTESRTVTDKGGSSHIDDVWRPALRRLNLAMKGCRAMI